MEALEVKASIAEGEQALQALLQFARESGSKFEARILADTGSSPL